MYQKDACEEEGLRKTQVQEEKDGKNGIACSQKVYMVVKG